MLWEEKEVVVQRVNEYRFYELGQKIGAIQGFDRETPYGRAWDPLWDARVALQRLKDDVVSVRISLPVVDRLVEAITTIVPTDISEAIEKMRHAEGAEPPKVGWPFYELAEALKQFEPVLAAECNALDTYVVSQKRGYSTPDLVDRSEVMVSLETAAMLDGGVRADIRAAGRCLAFDTPTAAGFHVLRATEAVMAMYYKHITGKELPKTNRNWGLYLKKVAAVATHDKKIYGALDHLREVYRNPITHPEVMLTEGEAIMVFSLSLSVIELMADIIRSTTPALTELEQAQALSEIAAPDEF